MSEPAPEARGGVSVVRRELSVVLVVLGKTPRAARSAERARGLVGERSSLARRLLKHPRAPKDAPPPPPPLLGVCCDDLFCPARAVCLEQVVGAV